MSLVEQELLRARWRRALERFGLERTKREGFAMGGLADRLNHVSVQVVLLPTDPESVAISLDETFAAWLQNQRTIALDDVIVQLPTTLRRTADATALVEPYDNVCWGSYFAVHRSGVLEFGLGSVGGWAGHDRAGNELRVIALTGAVARVWALLQFARSLQEKALDPGPYLLAVAVPHAGGALLGALSEGWAQPGDFQNSIGPCRDAALLWHLELPSLPQGDDARALAYSVGDRLEDAWGCASRRYLARRGEYVGKVDPRCM